MGLKTWMSKVCLTTGVWLSPTYAQSVATGLMESIKGVEGEIAKGREGGVLIVSWGVTDEGKRMGKFLETVAIEGAAHARVAWEKK